MTPARLAELPIIIAHSCEYSIGAALSAPTGPPYLKMPSSDQRLRLSQCLT